MAKEEWFGHHRPQVMIGGGRTAKDSPVPIQSLAYCGHDVSGLAAVKFGVDLRDGSGAMAKDDTGGLDTKLLSEERRRAVPKLIWRPPVVLPPLLLLFFGRTAW